MNDESSSESSGQSLVGSIVADRYQVLQLLGEGAMGAVYRALHIHMQKVVALKVLHRETSLNPEVVKRFEREAVAAGKVGHPNVAGAQDFGRLSDGCFYLVLEFVDGRSLRDVLHTDGALPVERSLRIAEQVAAALHAAHQHGIVHRDLKPENIMLLVDPAGGDFVKVLDFGLAKLGQDDPTDTKLTKMGAVYGTPQYMAPEQAAGNEVDHRADLYALGCILFEMLEGRPPFVADQVMALLIKHMTEAPPPPNAGLPALIRELVLDLLAKEPSARPGSAEEFLFRLAAFDPSFGRGSRLSMASGYLSPLSSRGASPPGGSSPEAASRVSGVGATERAPAGPLPLAPLVSAFRAVATRLRVKVTLLGRKVPLAWPLGVGLTLVLGAFMAVTCSGGRPDDKEALLGSVSATAVNEVIDPELLKVIEDAKRGSDAALYALEQRGDDARSTKEWEALAEARFMRRRVPEGLLALEKALARDPSLAEDKNLLGALRALADSDEHAKAVLPFVAAHLGSTGADFLFHVWAKTSLKTTSTTLAGDLLNQGDVKKNWSKALSVALDLRKAESCADYKELLPRVKEFGDNRVMNRLRDLSQTRGCGPAKRDDCYPCLREGKEFDDALSQAAMRAAPQFERGRRFRFKDE